MKYNSYNYINVSFLSEDLEVVVIRDFYPDFHNPCKLQ
jgi:hypothetical protein